MGSTWSFDGEIRIDPPLNYGQIKQFRVDSFAQLRQVDVQRLNRLYGDDAANQVSLGDFFSLILAIEEDEKETDEGIVQIQRAHAVVPAFETMRSPSYSMVGQVERLIKLFPLNTFTGEIVTVGEQNSGAVKVVAKHGQVDEVKGKVYVLWNDGSEKTDVTDL